MELSDLPAMYRSAVTVEPEYGCWRWTGPTTPSGYPAYKRQSAWMWAYRHLHGELPKAEYPTIETCHGPIFCANPEHRLNLPIDQAQHPHRCPVCRKWHDPDEEFTPPGVQYRRLQDNVRLAVVTPAEDPELTSEQQALENMMDD